MMSNTHFSTMILVAILLGDYAGFPTSRSAIAVDGSESRSQPTRPISSYMTQNLAQPIEENKQRLREGTKITNRLGRFRQSGDRATFVTENNIELGGLPNLNLERVVRMLKNVDEPESIWWSVSGQVTEFSGRNYLLIDRAVYKSATPPPTPEKVEP
jgi:hypothetical protein